MSIIVDNLGRVWARESLSFFGHYPTPEPIRFASRYLTDYYLASETKLYYVPNRQEPSVIQNLSFTQLAGNYGLDIQGNLFEFSQQQLQLITTEIANINWNGSFLAAITKLDELIFISGTVIQPIRSARATAKIIYHSEYLVAIRNNNQTTTEVNLRHGPPYQSQTSEVNQFYLEYSDYLVFVENYYLFIEKELRLIDVVEVSYYQDAQELVIVTPEAVTIFSYVSGLLITTNLSGFGFSLRHLAQVSSPKEESLGVGYYRQNLTKQSKPPVDFWDRFDGYYPRLFHQLPESSAMLLVHDGHQSLLEFFRESYSRYVSYHGHDYLILQLTILRPWPVQSLVIKPEPSLGQVVKFLQLGLEYNQIMTRYSGDGKDILVDRYGTIFRCDPIMPGSVYDKSHLISTVMISSSRPDFQESYLHSLAEDILAKLPGDYSPGQFMEVNLPVPSHLKLVTRATQIIDYSYSDQRGVVIESLPGAEDNYYQEADLSLVAHLEHGRAYAQDELIPLKIPISFSGKHILSYSRLSHKWLISKTPTERHLDKLARYQTITKLDLDYLISNPVTNSHSLGNLISYRTKNFLDQWKLSNKVLVDINPEVTNLALWQHFGVAKIYALTTSHLQEVTLSREAKRLGLNNIRIINYKSNFSIKEAVDVIICLDSFSYFFQKSLDSLAELIIKLSTSQTVFLWKLFQWDIASKLFYPSIDIGSFTYGDFSIVLDNTGYVVPKFKISLPGSPPRNTQGIDFDSLLIRLGHYSSQTETIQSNTLNGIMGLIARCYEFGYLKLS